MNSQQDPKSNQWLKRASYSATPSKPRPVDQELRRLKSLAVVSGLKAFTQEPQALDTSEPSSPTVPVTSGRRRSSTSYPADMRRRRSPSLKNGTSSLQLGPTTTQTKRLSTHEKLQKSKLDELQNDLLTMFEELYHKHNKLNDREPNQSEHMTPSASNTQPSVQETDTNVDSHQANDYELLYAAMLERQKHADQHMQQTMMVCLEQKEKAFAKIRELSDVVLKQDHLIQHLELNLEQALKHNVYLQSCLDKSTWAQDLAAAQQRIDRLRQDIANLENDKRQLQDSVHMLTLQLEQSQRQLEETTQSASRLRAECEAQHTLMANKLQPLKHLMLEKMAQSKYPDTDSHATQQKSRYSFTSVASSQIPSLSDTSSQASHHSTWTETTPYAQWKGGPLLVTQPTSVVAVRTTPTTATVTVQDTFTGSGDTFGTGEREDGDSQSTASSFLDDPESMLMYREFTEQLQAKLSISKEISDLHLWRIDDLDDSQRRIGSHWAHDPKHQHYIKGAPFWRSMKKKLKG